MELKKYFLSSVRPLKRNLQGQGPITLTKVLNNAIKMKATYSGGLLRYNG